MTEKGPELCITNIVMGNALTAHNQAWWLDLSPAEETVLSMVITMMIVSSFSAVKLYSTVNRHAYVYKCASIMFTNLFFL